MTSRAEAAVYRAWRTLCGPGMSDERISYSALKGMSVDELRARLAAEPARSVALVRAAAQNGI